VRFHIFFAVGEPFRAVGKYNFKSSDMTKRVNALGIIMLKERLTPPPKEAYSLHRKLSGAFLTCIKLRASVDCRCTFFAALLPSPLLRCVHVVAGTCCFRSSMPATRRVLMTGCLNDQLVCFE
jgi:hypothetical protein